MQEPFAEILRQFGLRAELDQLPGGSHPTFRAGRAVLKHVEETSLENNHSPQLMEWIADFTPRLDGRGFRLPQPIATVDGRWMTDTGWTPWGKAHRWCFGRQPAVAQPQLQPLVRQLYALRRPISTSPAQLVHGDLNPENILIAPGLPPAFLDLSPFWAPPEFALAMFANWIGPRRGDIAVLRHFAAIQDFRQILIRAAIRMLLVMAVIDYLRDWETSSEKRAAELVIQVAAMA